MTDPTWRAARNEQAFLRLLRTLPDPFPGCVLAHALRLRFLSPTPRRAVESYWRAHPLRADRLARALAARSGVPEGWTWELGDKDSGRPTSFRAPPAPYREAAFARGPGACCVCGQPAFRFGWHADLWGDGRPNRNATWHAACVVAWKLWTAPSDHVRHLRRLQGRRCAESGARLSSAADVDHRTPLFRVWRDHRRTPWPEVLAFWSPSNLQVVNRAAHRLKSATEAVERRGAPQLSS